MRRYQLIVYALLFTISASFGQEFEYKINPRTGKFDMVRSIEGISNVPYNGNRVITRVGIPNVIPGGTTIIEYLDNFFYPSTTPTATISVSGGNTREFMSAGPDLSVDLTWSGTRPLSCTPIATILVDGVSQTLMIPFNEGQVQNGVLAGRSLPRNSNKTFTVSITAEDGKSGSASTSVTWSWRRYWGSYASAVPPTDGSFSITDAQVLALNGAGVGSGNEFATTRLKTYNGINGAGNYLVFAFPSTWGDPTFKVNGLTSTAFTRVRNNAFVNTSGGSTNYQIWVSNTEQNSPIAAFAIE